MGGRGSSAGGRMGGGGGLNPADIISTRSLVSERERKQKAVDEVLATFRDAYEEHGYQVADIELAKLKGKSAATVLGYYDGANIAMNEEFFDAAKIEQVYKSSVESGYHPSSGSKTAIQAVTAHEIGHALTVQAGNQMGLSGYSSIDAAADRIVTEARSLTKHRGVVQLARGISGYATTSNAEAVAEAYADVYCNGTKAREESRAIVKTLKKYL